MRSSNWPAGMEADPDAGLIQTVPRLIHGRTAFARLQQFAGRIYGPVIATGSRLVDRIGGQLLGTQRNHPAAGIHRDPQGFPICPVARRSAAIS